MRTTQPLDCRAFAQVAEGACPRRDIRDSMVRLSFRHEKTRPKPRSVFEAEARAAAYFTENSRVSTTVPSSEISSLYVPTGQPSG